MSSSSFERIGLSEPAIPVVLSVPHAGRDYCVGLREALRVPLDRIVALEDRYVDHLAFGIGETGAAGIVAKTPRAWIDLNRQENEVDPQMVVPSPVSAHITQSLKVRGGLGLIPRRLAGVGDLWRDRVTADDLAARIDEIHRPYHAALARMLAETRARFGVAVLVDLHSMPPVTGAAWPRPPRIVIGDRFGRSASSRFTTRLMNEVEGFNLTAAENSPYAGGYILDRHGVPEKGIHALQVEIDRSLYLKPDLRTLDEDAAVGMGDFVRRMILALADEAFVAPHALAAE